MFMFLLGFAVGCVTFYLLPPSALDVIDGWVVWSRRKLAGLRDRYWTGRAR